VLALHLLSTAGTWWITDHGEILAVASRFLEHGRLDLEDLGPGWEDWQRIVAARPNAKTRFLPLSILSLTPFLLIDHALGLQAPGELLVVHLQGHFFVALALLVVGRFVAKSAGDRMAALAVLLVGLNWPVWMIARRLGPEPVLLFLMAAFVFGGMRSRILCLLILPWLHATGPLLGLCALTWLSVALSTKRIRDLAITSGSWAAGVTSLIVFWNLPVHGRALLGGYGAYATERAFSLRDPLTGLATLTLPLLLWTAPLWLLALRAPRRSLEQILALWLPALCFFALLAHPNLLPSAEPERRLATLLAATTMLVMASRNSVSREAAAGLSLAALGSGLIGLSRDFVTLVETPLGVYAGPHLLFIRLAFSDGHPWFAAAGVGLLLTMAIVAARRVFGPLAEPTLGVGSNHGPGPELKS
jgi:hypothetical protein